MTFWEEVFSDLKLFDIIVLSILIISLIVYFVTSLKDIPFEYAALDRLGIVAEVIGRGIAYLLVFVVYRAIRIHIKKNKKKKVV